MVPPKPTVLLVVDTAMTESAVEAGSPVMLPDRTKPRSIETFTVTLLVAFTPVTDFGNTGAGACELAVAAQISSTSVTVKSFPFMATSFSFPIE
jgi:hypothetical protein